MRPPAHIRSPRSAARLLLVATIVALATGCSDAGRSPSQPNVILILVDTLRADRLSLYGYPRPTSPALDKMARQAIVFDNARAQAGCTYPSVNSIMTSQYPQRFLGQADRRIGIPDDVPSLPEILKEHGYATAALSASLVVRKRPSRLNKQGGFDRGFDVFDEECAKRRARCVNRRALDQLEELSEPFFLYLHYMEPHAPYKPPAGHMRRFARPYTGPKWVLTGNINPLKKEIYHGAAPVRFSDADLAHLRDLYDEEIRSFDDNLGRLLDELDERRLLERSLLIFASDHGEEILDHGHIAHCRNLAFDTLLATPLVMRLPTLRDGGRRRSAAQNLDIVPTILDYLGIDAGRFDFEGRSLRPVIDSDRPVHRTVFGSQGTSRALLAEGYKSIYDLRSQQLRLFDLRHDPGETRDVAAERPEVAELHRELIERWRHRVEGRAGDQESIRRAEEVERMLEALGYL